MSFWVGFADAVEKIQDRKSKKELLADKEFKQRSENLMSRVMEKREAIREAASAKSAVFKKGINLFGERVATILENTGQLSDVLSNYEGTENEKAWTKTVMARTEDYIAGLLESEDQDDVKLGTNLLKRGSMYSDASLEQQQEYIDSIIADGVVTQEEYMSMDLTTPDSTFTEKGPNLGKFDVYSPSQLDEVSANLAANAFEGAKVIPLESGGYRVDVRNVSPQLVAAVQNEIRTSLAERQYSQGTSGAKTSVLMELSDTEEYKKRAADKYGVTFSPVTTLPEPAPTVTQETVTRPMQLQGGMGDADVEPELTPDYMQGTQPGGFNAGVLEETQERFTR